MFYTSINGNQIYKPLDDLLVLFNPKLTLEIGKAGSLEFDIPQVNPFYDKLNQLTTEVSVDMDSEEIFHGRVLSVERGFNNVRHVYCEGDLSYLIDSVQKGVQFNGTTHELFRRIIANHNSRVDDNKKFTVGTINIEDRSIVLVGHSEGDNINAGNIDYKQIAIDSVVDEWNNSYDYIQTCLIDYCGGYLRTRRFNGTTYIDLLSDFGSTSVQEIELGRNMLDLSEELSVEDVFTVLIPLGEDNLTIASVNSGSDELIDRDAVARFGRIVRTHVFNNVTSASTLMENAQRFLATNLNIPRTVSVRAVDLHLINKNINPIRIGDRVTITSYVHEVDDTLTCTKIEYDLEKPDNNNYTFGNPRQTLTQRYREDVRLSNDTYGNSAAPATASAATPRAVASAGAAAAASAEAAEETQTKALQSFYDAWIDVKPEQGTVSLGALYNQYVHGKEVLISQCGIDLDGQTGNININSLHNTVDSLGNVVAANEARIDVIQTDTSAAIESVVTRQNNLEGVEAQHYAGVTQRVDDLSSEVAMTAKDVREVDGRLTSTLASVTARTDDLESRVTTTASYLGKVDGKLVGHIAEITAWANETESAIQLKADKVYVDGQLEAAVAIIDDLTAGRTTASKIRATDILAGSISLFSEGGAVPVATLNHSHNFAILEGSNGDITISIGGGTTSIPQKQSFNIANTKYYKDNVAAVSIKSLEPDSYSSSGDYTATLEDGYVRYSNEQITGRVRITLGNNDTKTAVVKVSGTRAYKAGVDAGAQTAKVKSVVIGAVGKPNVDQEGTYWAIARVTGIAQGTKSDDSVYTDDSYSRNISIDVTAAYNEGKAAGSESSTDDVRVQTLGIDSDSEISYSASVNNYYIPIKATLNTGKNPRTTTITVSGAAAANSVYTTGIAYYTQSGEQTVTYNADNKTLNASVQASLSNGNTKDSIRTVTIPATLAYKAGGDDVTATVGLNKQWSYSSNGYIYETANRRYRVSVIANLSNGKTPGTDEIYIPAIEAYEAGAASVETATVKSLGIDPDEEISYSSSVNNYYIPIIATMSAGDPVKRTITVSGAAARNSVSTTGIAYYTQSGESTVSYNADNKTISASVQATLSNGNTNGSVRTVTIPAALAYNAGRDSVGASVSMSAAATTTSNKGVINATATLENGKTASNSANVYLNVTENSSSKVTMAIVDGGSNTIATRSVSVTSVSVSSAYTTRQAYNDYYLSGNAWHIPTKIVVSLSDGSSKTYSSDVTVQDVVQAAQSSGGEVSINSIEAESGYDGNTRSLFRITLSNGQVLRAWANHA